MRASTRFVRKLGFVAVFASVLAMLVGGHGIRQAHASAPPYQPGDLTAQGPFSPWFGSVTSDLSWTNNASKPPVVITNPYNPNENGGDGAEVFTAIRENVASQTNACVYGTTATGCAPSPDQHDWPTYLCDQIFQQVRASNSTSSGADLGGYTESSLMEKAVGCTNAFTGTLSAARTNDQCIDFEFLMDPISAQWDEKVAVKVFTVFGGVRFTTHYLFTTRLQLDLRFELCNGGFVDGSDPNSKPLSVNPSYNPDGVADCVKSDGTKQCGVTVTFRNVSVSHNRTAGVIDWINITPGTSTENLKIAHDFMFSSNCTPDGTPQCARRTILDPSTFSGPLDNINANIRVGANGAAKLTHDPRFTVVLSLTDDLAEVLEGAFVHQLPGELNIELRQDSVAQLQVAGSTGCNGVFSTTVDLVGLNFPANKTGGNFFVHDETRSVPDVTGTFTTDANGGFDTGPLAMAAQTGDKIAAAAFLGTAAAAGVLDPIQYCIG